MQLNVKAQFFPTDDEMFKPIVKDTTHKKKARPLLENVKQTITYEMGQLKEAALPNYENTYDGYRPNATTYTENKKTGVLVEQVFKNKVLKLKSVFFERGFETYKSSDIDMKHDENYPIFVDLQKGKLYQFIFVGDPDANKIEVKLAKEDYGNMVTDRFRVASAGEYWTQFSFIPPVSGQYLLTLYQRANFKDLFGHLTIMRKKGNQVFSFDARDSDK
jgi:hypothetical protein